MRDTHGLLIGSHSNLERFDMNVDSREAFESLVDDQQLGSGGGTKSDS